MFNRIKNAFLFPFKAGFEFADARPSLSSVRSHLSAVKARVDEDSTSGRLSVRLVSADDPKVDIASLYSAEISPESDSSVAMAYAGGVAKGYSLAQEEIAQLTRTQVAARRRILREATQEKADTTPVADGNFVLTPAAV